MPLRCIDSVSECDVRAFDLSLEAWDALKSENTQKRHLRMPCCPSQVVLKKSSLGTRFFAHKATGECTTAPETETHLRLKQLSVEVARAHGWEADTEVAGITPTGERWRADVLARKGSDQLAIEVQWSSQTTEETSRRQQRYIQAGIQCVWIFRQSNMPIERELPIARIGGDPKIGLDAEIPTTERQRQIVPMQEFLGAVFDGRLHFGVPPRSSMNVSINSGKMFCWSCGTETSIVTFIDVSSGPHDCQLSVSDLQNYPELLAAVQSHISNEPSIGKIKPRYSRAVEQSYLSNGCAHCDVLIGSFYEHEAWEDQRVVCAFKIQTTDSWQQTMDNMFGWRGWGIFPAE